MESGKKRWWGWGGVIVWNIPGFVTLSATLGFPFPLDSFRKLYVLYLKFI